MISKDGTGYWATGILVHWDDHNHGWHAIVEYLDDGWAGDNDTDMGRISTEGRLETRYAVRDGGTASGLSAAVDAVMADAEQLGVRFVDTGSGGPWLYYKGDGEDRDYPAPIGWRQILSAESVRIGWAPFYKAEATR
jgi:hypothetical protein